ncbi:MAG: 2-succinyl-5-enolpyruvyl-6-hydroxy-3-cyclohexene-1-carboxylic-acid synthase [Candidatus Eisenbacteria bacterium]|uniref:2-succinyl-5-enolpyruvyl-6-hydroxy-3-cyclohexene-1-carboxylate synthase n=1 Tax=Eiseniibacteriota bacterium TaxID=2212470 RepID=A0A948W450_UNCEI|nr:2-succinyl-5-enolpyruvyl-6-hydroxy-3-cyclohexene-1-carboxylic-acid synthase [Candidatus Eisenbacteria bacterium]MBU1947283.1 2-succinyl-5-enolpyruvyl-6-hydroxy-3-cyclohexene-1-carboxylic-acid synthase [Candidatus Eisenbacteria bacterium]MBU2691822.1 2-succinyl-5-enolpyruvyl-6-hydroxy-3-cyclohexene-1-carboxylic-acid synthase [Candidatus Eisenbacteria bacterium]
MPTNRSGTWAGVLVEELANAGLEHLCAGPGSRSTPLILAFNKQPGIRLWTHLDERSMGYFALGMAKILRKPVALLCTSGTAAANFYPAVAEAFAARIPLLVLTADRPPELVDWGAPQTMNQTGLYGSFVKVSVTLPKPEISVESIRYLRAIACRAMASAGAAPAGPVHLNIPLVEPLVEPLVASPVEPLVASLVEPLVDPLVEPLVSIVDPPASPAGSGGWFSRGGRDVDRAYTQVPVVEARIDKDSLRRLADDLLKEAKGLIIAGPMAGSDATLGIAALARRLGYPILADPLSQLRCGPHDKSLIVDSYDFILRSDVVRCEAEPKIILRFGALPSSKPMHLFLQHHTNARQILVDPGSWRDPHHLLWDLISVDESVFCRELVDRLPDGGRRSGWADRWMRLAAESRGMVSEHVSERSALFEGRVFQELKELLPGGSTLFAGNSMPIRDLDDFFPKCDREIRLLGNRGLNGIDGVVSTALGTAAVAPGKPVVAVLGDISFYHDLNGLLAATRHGLHVVFIVVNNNGGGIFSFLPQAGDPQTLDPLFAMPHGLTFQDAARLYGLQYRLVESWTEFRIRLSDELQSARSSIIEIPGDREINRSLHEEIWAEGITAASEVWAKG